MPNRKFSAVSGYRYGFNGKENDNEAKGEGNQQDYGFRIYDTRIGRFLSEDPLTKKYPELTPYQFGSNNPIQNIDLDGLEGVKSIDNANKTVTFQIDLHYLRTAKGQSKTDKVRSLSAKEIEKIRAGFMKEVSKKGVPNTVRFIGSTYDKENDKINFFDENYTIQYQLNFIGHDTYAEAQAATSVADKSEVNRSSLLYYQRSKSQEIPNPNYDPNDPSKGPELYISATQGSSSWRRTVLSSLNSHTITHEIFHNFIHSFPNTKFGITNNDQGHQNAGGIFVYKNEQLGTDYQNLNYTNINQAFSTVPTIAGGVPRGTSLTMFYYNPPPPKPKK